MLTVLILADNINDDVEKEMSLIVDKQPSKAPRSTGTTNGADDAPDPKTSRNNSHNLESSSSKQTQVTLSEDTSSIPSSLLPKEHRRDNAEDESVQAFLKLLNGDVNFESIFNPEGSVLSEDPLKDGDSALDIANLNSLLSLAPKPVYPVTPIDPTPQASTDYLSDFEKLLNEVSSIDQQQNGQPDSGLFGLTDLLLGKSPVDNDQAATDNFNPLSLLSRGSEGLQSGVNDWLSLLLGDSGASNTPESSPSALAPSTDQLSGLGDLGRLFFDIIAPGEGSPPNTVLQTKGDGRNKDQPTLENLLLGSSNTGNSLLGDTKSGQEVSLTSEVQKLIEAETDVLKNFEQQLRNYLASGQGDSESPSSLWSILFPSSGTKSEGGSLLSNVLSRKSDFIKQLRDQFVSTFMKIINVGPGRQVDPTTVDSILDPTIEHLSQTFEKGGFGVIPLLGSTKKLLRTLRDDVKNIVNSLTPAPFRKASIDNVQGFVPLDDRTIYNLGPGFESTVSDLNRQFPESRSDKAGVIWHGLTEGMESRLKDSLKKHLYHREKVERVDPILTTDFSNIGHEIYKSSPPIVETSASSPTIAYSASSYKPTSSQVHFIHLPPNSLSYPKTNYHQQTHANYPAGHDPITYSSPTTHHGGSYNSAHATSGYHEMPSYGSNQGYQMRTQQPGFHPDQNGRTNWKIDFLLDWNTFGRFGGKYMKRNYQFRPFYGNPALFEQY